MRLSSACLSVRLLASLTQLLLFTSAYHPLYPRLVAKSIESIEAGSAPRASKHSLHTATAPISLVGVKEKLSRNRPLLSYPSLLIQH
ncbi:uncharacterized protein BO66DRAFT_235510 [Aspergillus aculeatinus CBS 121060]|uniref:Uncharacterized protein n=1 Tax=Aspergillus aculeatinus CBS 121060 TaxID=1448322 RepID=A0ACD1HI80_9EURO|nr:hypothetical protein BO66DRAFT_235510 [Aspergillus aculeatinus CBS 121060]RAH73122.1 hypothetical protein BO66DRAFT_235510 [Aspergillus aculeatinus CBS 121060]